MMRKFAVIATAILFTVPFISTVNASEQTSDLNLESAHDIVERYREMRSSCASAKDQARVECFSALNSATQEYTQAKKVIKAQKAKTSQDSVHFVGFTGDF